MFKKIMKGIVIGGALLALTTPAMADIEVNIFGASAQFLYWTEGAPSFLRSTVDSDPEVGTPAVACPAADVWHARTASAGLDSRDSGIAICNKNNTLRDASGALNITSNGGSPNYADDVVIRYTTFASAEGLLAAREENPSGTDPDCNPDERLMAVIEGTTDATDTRWSSGSVAPLDGGVTEHECKDVTLGTSDIDPECFTQRTEGPWKWDQFGGGIGTTTQWDDAYDDYHATPSDDTNWTERIFNEGDPLPEVPWSGMDKANPFVVPFAFFVNNNTVNPVPINNMTKGMAQMIFSGGVGNWSLFDDSVDIPVKVCIRHAGSGTHATLDWAVVRAKAVNLVEDAIHPDRQGAGPAILTNKGSSDNVECSGKNEGAISYADADKLGKEITANPTYTGSKGNNKRLTYQGFAPTRDNVKSCFYDFWGANVLYWQTAEHNAVQKELVAFASDSDNMVSGVNLFWAAQSELRCDRADCRSIIRDNPND